VSQHSPAISRIVPEEVLMERDELRLLRTASFKIIIPIFGMIGGLLIGLVWAKIERVDEFTEILFVVKGAFAGSVLGMGTILATSLGLEWKHFASLQALMVVIAVSALFLIYLVTIVFDLVPERGS
jgi:hypothetical protein